MTHRHWIVTLGTWLLSITFVGNATGQSSTRVTPETNTASPVQEDFYQPVQELWNNQADRNSDFVPTGEMGGSPQNLGGEFQNVVPTGPNLGSPQVVESGETYISGNPIAPIPIGGTAMDDGPIDVGELGDAVPVENGAGLPALATEPPCDGACALPPPQNPLANVVASPTCGTMFFRWDALYGGIDDPDGVPIGSPTAAGVFLSNGITYPFQNTLSTDVIHSNPVFGNRFEFGEISGNGGWMVGILDWEQGVEANAAGGGIQFDDPLGMLSGYSDVDNDGFDDDLDLDNTYGRDGTDLGTPDPANPGTFLPIFDGTIDQVAPADTGDLVTFVPIFSNLTVRSVTDISGFELLKAFRRPRRPIGPYGFEHFWTVGIRYIDVDDRFNLNGEGSFFDTVSINNNIENFIIGPQIGTEFVSQVGNWRIGGSTRFLVGLNLQRGEQSGSFITTGSPGGVNQPLNLFSSSFSNVAEDEVFSPVLEWRLDAVYDMGKHLGIRVGYTGMLIGGVARAPSSVTYSLPDFGLALGNNDEIFFNALTGGIEWRY